MYVFVDTYHFGTVVEGWLCTMWVALLSFSFIWTGHSSEFLAFLQCPVTGLFVTTSHQTGLDPKVSLQWRLWERKVKHKTNPTRLCWSSAHLVQCEPDEPCRICLIIA